MRRRLLAPDRRFGSPPDPESAVSEIATEIKRVHEDTYGETVEHVDVLISEDSIVAVMDIGLTGSEKTLIDAGHAQSIGEQRDLFQMAIRPVFDALVERAIGRRVHQFASRTVIEEDGQSWSVEIFRLEPPTR